ncbi:unnamed protein product [Rotaria sp. Silwood1]|nr:unnamed protein product [Rotaria sp. Silwood1]CAF1159244.1 unnamed protein product [Rotaria sp. Silwood1]CAF3435470.1 unnamed protein product [Rotaria sp. Silwood1]CAF3461699.1 unnamed protein product [Rotaria sp. Silwood1]CAF4808099.1 unnamed protein product [Rotaria sp. Silwood1]
MQATVYLAAAIFSALLIGDILQISARGIRCPGGELIADCFEDPCSVSTCPGDKNATCVSNYCGGCNALWYGADGNLANCNNTSSCPPDKPPVQCFADPCQVATCSAYPNATCVANYCGGCNTEWFTANGEQVQC